MTVVRSTLKERNAAVIVYKKKRKPVYTKPKGKWTFEAAAQLCTVANLTLHSDAEVHWYKQTIRGSSRTMLLADGRQSLLNNIVSGKTSGIQATPELKAASNAKRSATHKELNAADPGSKHWKEAAAIGEVMVQFTTARPDFEWRPLPDGLGSDLVIRRKGTGDFWTAVQMKSAIANPEEKVHLHVEKKDGINGGKYEVRVTVH
jgi:hypothetical protein